MALGISQIKKLCHASPALIERVSDEQFLEGHAGIDLRLGAVYKLEKNSRTILGPDGERDTTAAKPEIVLAYPTNPLGTPFVLRNDFVLMETVERVNLPKNVIGFIWPRATLSTLGIYISGTVVHPGYSGGLIVGVRNLGPGELLIKLGSPFVNITFFNVEGEADPYSSGDKVQRVKRGISERAKP
jgi:deoxycytidine triphosphate deaminase